MGMKIYRRENAGNEAGMGTGFIQKMKVAINSHEVGAELRSSIQPRLGFFE